MEKGEAAMIQLEGEKESILRHTRRVIRAASEGGVHEVVFVPSSKSIVGMEKRDLEMILPGADTGPQMDPLLVAIDAKGAVFFGRGLMREEVDGADAGRDLPVLRKRLAVWSKLGEEHGMRAVAQLRVHDNAPQERVVDVLNAFAKEKITKVTMEDLVDEAE